MLTSFLQIDESKYAFIDDDWKRIPGSDSGVSILRFLFFFCLGHNTNQVTGRRRRRSKCARGSSARSTLWIRITVTAAARFAQYKPHNSEHTTHFTHFA